MDSSRSILVVCRTGPHGSPVGPEALELTLMAGAFDRPTALLLLDEGVLQLVRGQAPEGLPAKDYAPGFAALGDHGVERVFVERQSLEERGLTPETLMIPVEPVDRSAVRALMAEADHVLSC